MPEKEPGFNGSPEEAKSELGAGEISDTQSFEELYAILDKKGKVSGSSRDYSAEDLKSRIEDVRSAWASSMNEVTKRNVVQKLLSTITASEGLRAKVSDLLLQDYAQREAEAGGESKEGSIEDAQSFEELYSILDRKGSLMGSLKEYKAEELKGAIVAAREIALMSLEDNDVDAIRNLLRGGSNKIISSITKTDGLRKKVSELIAIMLEEKIGPENIDKFR